MLYQTGKPGLFEFAIGHGGKGCKGTEITIKADPVIEDFVRDLGDGTVRPLQAGYAWYPINPIPAEIYTFGNGELPAPDFDTYQMDAVNKGLVLEGDAVNLSFLRFKGIGSPLGVTFGIKAVYSPSLMESLKTRIGKACRQLCRDYIVPVTMRLVIVNKDTE